MSSPWKDLGDLAAVEDRLAAEKAECDRLVSQIMALQDESARAEADLVRGSGKKQPVAPEPQPASTQQQVRPMTKSSSSPVSQLSFTGMSSMPNRTAPPPPPSRTSIAPGTGRQLNAEQQQYPAPPKSVVTARSGRSVSPARSAVTYRSSMYRSVSPSKQVKNGVIISNFGRSSRFKDDKTDVPGPGKYAVPTSTMSQVSVQRDNKAADQEGRLGHTWDNYYTAKGIRPSAAQQHQDAMVAATARIKSPGDMTSRAGGLLLTDRDLPGSPGSMASGYTGFTAGGVSTINGGQGGVATVAAQADAMIAGYNGDVRQAIEACIRRERALRKEVASMRNSSSSARLESSHALSTLSNEVLDLKGNVDRRDTTIAAITNKVKAFKDVFVRSDEALNLLQRVLAEAVSVVGSTVTGGGRSPVGQVLQRAQEQSRVLEGVLAAGIAMAAPNGGGGSGASVAGSDIGGGSISGGGGYTGYSSLSAALVTPEASNMGIMGASAQVVNNQNLKTSLVASGAGAPPPPPPRDRPLTGAQARGIGPGVDLASRGLSVTAIAAFARRAAEAGTNPSGGPHAITRAIAAAGAGAAPSRSSSPVRQGQQQQPFQRSASAASGWGGEDGRQGQQQVAGSPSPPRDFSSLIQWFADDFLKPNVLQFFNSHKSALQAIFAQYAAAPAGGSSASSSSSSLRIPSRALSAFGVDYAIVPGLVSAQELTGLVAEVARAVGRADDAAAAPSLGLSYPEWIELLGLIAYVTAAYNNTSNGGFSNMPMLQRLHLLFYNMSRGGARFPAGDAGASLVREATEAVTGGQPARR